jgi:hypothetical protein
LFVPPEDQKRMSLDTLCDMTPAIDLSDHRTQALAEAAVEALQQLLLSQQKLMQLIYARQALLNHRDDFLLQQGDFLLVMGSSIQVRCSGSPRLRRRISSSERSLDSSRRNESSSGRQNGERATAELLAESMAMRIGADCGAATGPILVEA